MISFTNGKTIYLLQVNVQEDLRLRKCFLIIALRPTCFAVVQEEVRFYPNFLTYHTVKYRLSFLKKNTI